MRYQYLRCVMSKRAESIYLNYLADKPWVSSGKDRLTLNYNYALDNMLSYVYETTPIEQPLLTLQQHLIDNGVLDSGRIQVYINLYPRKYSGINLHVDPLVFGSKIVTFSLGAPCYIKFVGSTVEQIRLESRSMFIVSDSARYSYKHGIDTIDTDDTRPCRVSITFRNIHHSYNPRDIPLFLCRRLMILEKMYHHVPVNITHKNIRLLASSSSKRYLYHRLYSGLKPRTVESLCSQALGSWVIARHSIRSRYFHLGHHRGCVSDLGTCVSSFVV
jgi:2OG-Fe(II) oxygenase superfamily